MIQDSVAGGSPWVASLGVYAFPCPAAFGSSLSCASAAIFSDASIYFSISFTYLVLDSMSANVEFHHTVRDHCLMVCVSS